MAEPPKHKLVKPEDHSTKMREDPLRLPDEIAWLPDHRLMRQRQERVVRLRDALERIAEFREPFSDGLLENPYGERDEARALREQERRLRDEQREAVIRSQEALIGKLKEEIAADDRLIELYNARDEKGRPGRPPKDTTSHSYKVWIELGRPIRTPAVLGRIARIVFPSEWEKATAGPTRRKLHERVRAAIKRGEGALQHNSPPI
jgi:hypothetical protein